MEVVLSRKFPRETEENCGKPYSGQEVSRPTFDLRELLNMKYEHLSTNHPTAAKKTHMV
jgi:hypothetical protein